MLLVEYKHVPKNKMRIIHCPVDSAKTGCECLSTRLFQTNQE